MAGAVVAILEPFPLDSERIAELEQRVRALEGKIKSPKHSDAPVSLSAAAKLLKVSKTRTLMPAIEAGKIKTVKVGNRQRIPADEINRVTLEGIRRPAGRRRKVYAPKLHTKISEREKVRQIVRAAQQ